LCAVWGHAENKIFMSCAAQSKINPSLWGERNNIVMWGEIILNCDIVRRHYSSYNDQR
jgi:hypothetical protein